MKTNYVLTALTTLTLLTACDDKDAQYKDLSTGENVTLEKDKESGLWVNTETGKPVEIYVDTRSKDTIWGATGKVINGSVVKRENGKWEYANDSRSLKVEIDGDNNRTGEETKIKYDDGEYKIKRGDDYKKEVERDGDIKIKDGNKKIKIDGETGERKVKIDN